MNKISKTSSLSINGGKSASKIYHCVDPNCSYSSTNFLSVYGHVLSSTHFKSVPYLNALWKAGWGCLTAGLSRYIKTM